MLKRGSAIVLLTLATWLLSCQPANHGDKDSDKPKLVFRLALELNAETELWQISHLYKQALEQAAPEEGIEAGEILVEFYDQGMIGTERQLLEACYFGVVEVVQVNTSVVSSVVPIYSLMDLPYIFVSDDHLKEVLHGPIGDTLLDELRQVQMQGLGFYSAGFRNMFYKKDDCAETAAELSGLKIRVMESPVMVSAINAIGPSATPIPFSELYQSLKTGVVDGAENSANIFISYNYYETGCNCFTLTEHFTNQHVLVANAAWLDGLDPKYKRRLHNAAREIRPEFNRIWDEAISHAYARIKEHGINLNRVRDKAEFVARTRHIADEMFDKNPALDRTLLQAIRSCGEKYLDASKEYQTSP